MSTAPEWADAPLYEFLVTHLPICVENPFSDTPSISVQRLRAATAKSHEGVYKWLRRGRLTPANAKLLLEVATSQENLDALQKLDRTPPKIEDFTRFIFA